MANSVNVQVTRTGRVRGPNLSDPQMKAVGDQMVQAQKDRWAKAINADGQPAKKLSVKYYFIKRKYKGGGSPVRDMNMTGRTIANFTLRKATNGVIRAENTSRNERAKALRAQSYEQMIGFAVTDSQAVFTEAEKQYGQWLQSAWVPLQGTRRNPW